jgi:ABC-2 type transport system ATP-binding protein
MIRFDNVTRTYGRKVAVDRLSLSVGRGEIFALLGPNGAGKTTAMKMLVGLLRPTSGAVEVCGCDVAAQPRSAAGFLGYVPEEPFLYDKLSGREFLEFAAEMRGLEAADRQARIARESRSFDMTGFLDDLVETYSHGMKQRLVFASALLHDPTVLVVDEPMVGLDPRSVRVVKDLLRSRAAGGAAVFMSTHTLAVAEEIADRIGILNDGRLHFLGTLAELRRQRSSPDSSLEPLFLEVTGNHDRPRDRGHG